MKILGPFELTLNIHVLFSPGLTGPDKAWLGPVIPCKLILCTKSPSLIRVIRTDSPSLNLSSGPGTVPLNVIILYSTPPGCNRLSGETLIIAWSSAIKVMFLIPLLTNPLSTSASILDDFDDVEVIRCDAVRNATSRTGKNNNKNCV